MSAVFDDHGVAPFPDATRQAARRADAAPLPGRIEPVPDSPCVTRHEFWLPGSGERGRTGVLLIHGLTGTPNEMRVLAKGLNRAGYGVYGVQLAGHCGGMDDLLASRWQDWAATVRAGADRLQHHVDRVVTIGLSMGATLALNLATEAPRGLAGVGALSTMFRYDGWSMPVYTRLSFLLKVFRAVGIGRRQVFMEQPPYGIKDEALRRRVVGQMHAGDSAAAGLPGNPWYSVIEMHDLAAHVKRRLRDIAVPCLAIHAAEDDVASLANLRVLQRELRAPLESVVLEDSYHMVTIDRERRAVMARTVAFVDRIAGFAADVAHADAHADAGGAA